MTFTWFVANYQGEKLREVCGGEGLGLILIIVSLPGTFSKKVVKLQNLQRNEINSIIKNLLFLEFFLEEIEKRGI